MKRSLAALFALITSLGLQAQLAGTDWSVMTPGDGDKVHFGNDNIMYLEMVDGYAPVSAYWEEDGVLWLTDIMETVCQQDTGTYEYVIVGDTLIFTELVDDCNWRVAFFTAFLWLFDTHTGITRSGMTEILVYPTPCSDHLYIEHQGSNELLVDLYDLNGREILKKSINEQLGIMDVSSLSRGVYQMIITEGSDRHTKRIVIE